MTLAKYGTLFVVQLPSSPCSSVHGAIQCRSPEGGRSLDSPSPENTSPVEGKQVSWLKQLVTSFQNDCCDLFQKKAQHDRLQFLNNSDIDGTY